MSQPNGAVDLRGARLVVAVVCAAAFIEALQFTILAPVLPVLADEFNLEDVQAGLVSSAYAIGLVLFQLPAGRIAARIDERIAVGGALLIIGVANLWFAFSPSVWQLGAARFISGAASALVWAGGLAWVSSTGSRSNQGTRLAAVISGAVLGSIVGPALGSLVTLTGRVGVFTGIAVVCFALTVPIWFLRVSHSIIGRSDRGLLALTAKAWLALLVSLFIGAFFSALGVMVPLEAVSMGAAATVVGFAFVVGSIGQAITAPLVGRLTDNRGAARVMGVALSAAAIATVGLIIAPGAWGPVIMLAVVIPIGGAVYTPTTVAVDDAAHELHMEPAIAFSAWNFTWAIGVGLGAVVGPWAAQVLTNNGVYAIMALISGALGVASWRQRTQRSAIESSAGE